MENELTLLQQIHQQFGETQTDIRTYSPLTLAYIGDAVFEMVIRTLIVEKGQKAANTLHRHTTKIVCAGTQAMMIESLAEELTEEEKDIYRKGRNTKIHSSAKNASLSDYRKATGFEALCGYLYLTDNMERMTFLVKRALELCEITIA